MQSELKNRAHVAAELAKQEGFEHTYLALIEVIKDIEREKASATSDVEFSDT